VLEHCWQGDRKGILSATTLSYDLAILWFFCTAQLSIKFFNSFLKFLFYT